MRIAIVAEHISPTAAVGGAHRDHSAPHIAELSAALSRAGHTLTVYTRRVAHELPDRVATEHGYTLVQVPAGPATVLAEPLLVPSMSTFGSFLAQEWMRNRPDVAHADSWTTGIPTQLAARDLGVPTVQSYITLGVTEHGRGNSPDNDTSNRIRLERVLAKGAGRVVVTCSEQVSDLARMGLPRTRVSVVPLGVDLDRFTVSGSETAPRRGQRYRLVVAGELMPEEGLDVAVAALPLMPDTELVIAGGVAHDAAVDERTRLLDLAEKLGVHDRVHVAGYVSHDDMPALLRSADVVVCTSGREPSASVALEAMACGRPVVASAVGTLRDTVVDGVTGLLVPPRSPRALATSVRELLADVVRHGSFGVAGRDRAVTRYSWDRVATDTLAAYGRVVRRSHPLPSSRSHASTVARGRVNTGEERADAVARKPSDDLAVGTQDFDTGNSQ
ncbi:glycosyltransferase [Rhodococcus sp. NPDC058639]|uniref:glycosyltransferase n=1 Tax=Rhodococcus sp. NPDC058639 TaxID=3346570 RepID=UPI00365AC593